MAKLKSVCSDVNFACSGQSHFSGAILGLSPCGRQAQNRAGKMLEIRSQNTL
jgi:hypothetical protein